MLLMKTISNRQEIVVLSSTEVIHNWFSLTFSRRQVTARARFSCSSQRCSLGTELWSGVKIVWWKQLSKTTVLRHSGKRLWRDWVQSPVKLSSPWRTNAVLCHAYLVSKFAVRFSWQKIEIQKQVSVTHCTNAMYIDVRASIPKSTILFWMPWK